MSKTTLTIKINEKTGQVGFLVEKNQPETVSGLLEFIGALELVKDAHVKKLGEIMRKEVQR